MSQVTNLAFFGARRGQYCADFAAPLRSSLACVTFRLDRRRILETVG